MVTTLRVVDDELVVEVEVLNGININVWLVLRVCRCLNQYKIYELNAFQLKSIFLGRNN